MSEHSMIERVARAICEAAYDDPDGRSGKLGVWAGDAYWQAYASLARAAIEAMMEPTEGMLKEVVPLPVNLAAEGVDEKYARDMEVATMIDRAAARSMFRSFITAALNEGKS